MTRREKDRRTADTARLPSPRSPVNVLLMTIVAVLGATAAATAVLGPGFDDQTPHGRVLGDLQRMANAQEDHHRDRGEFAYWLRTLGVESSDEVRLTVLRADSTKWEALAEHDVGLACTLGGGFDEAGRYARDEAGCFMKTAP